MTGVRLIAKSYCFLQMYNRAKFGRSKSNGIDVVGILPGLILLIGSAQNQQA